MASNDDSPTREPRRVIKRYANRKLYDTTQSRYVTLKNVAALVRAGHDVQILDNKTKEDLTSVTLAQIIYESKRAEHDGGEGSKNLRELIQSGGERLRASLKDKAVGRLLRSDETNPARQGLAALEELQRKADEGMRGVLETILAPMRQLQDDLARLQKRLDELESSLRRGKRRERDSHDAKTRRKSRK